MPPPPSNLRYSYTPLRGFWGAGHQDISANGFLTTYQYDALGNLLQVNQSGINARTFAYDSLSRLLTASNPESGSISYAYDANGNLITKTAPAPNQTGTASVTTTFQYDALNRLTQKSYSDGTTPTASYAYDTPNSNFGCGGTPTNVIGRLTGASNGWPYCYQYDQMGRLSWKDIRMNPGNELGYFSYSYDLMGNLVTDTAGYGYRDVSYAYNTAGRLISVINNDPSTDNPANSFSITGNGSDTHYNAFGGLTANTLGDGEAESYSYDNRLRLKSYTATINSPNYYNTLITLYSFTINSFAPNSDVLSANDSVNGNWTYSYDPFNRLVGANQNSGAAVYSYVYDRFGNRWQQNGTTNSFVATFTGNNPGNPQNNNRIDGYTHDAAGNVMSDSVHSYTFDAENRMIKVDGGSTATYSYDVDGHRVEKTTATGNYSDPAGTWIFLYDQSGRYVIKMNSSYTFAEGQIYAGSRHLASVGGWMTFSHSDWVGTERFRTYMASVPYTTESCTSLPFGDGLNCTGSDVSNLHFTGKERDAATGLDNFGARYYSSSMGRWATPDWAAKPTAVPYAVFGNPQSLNLYGYVGNNPISRIDPDGHTCDDKSQKGCFWQKLWNKIAYGEFVTNNNLEAALAQHPERIEKMKQEIHRLTGVGYNDLDKLSNVQVMDAANRVKIEQTENPYDPGAAIGALSFSAQSLQHEFTHASDFGVKGNWNNENAARFQQALEDVMNGPNTKEFEIEFRGQPGFRAFVDQVTGKAVVFDPNGEFRAAWDLGADQVRGVVVNGKLW
jgi:RHS repeat-associated protein